MSDAERINQARTTLPNEEARWSRFFAPHGVAPLCLRYEDLAADPSRVLAETLAALGLDPTHATGVSAQTARMSDATSAAWIRKMKAG